MVPPQPLALLQQAAALVRAALPAQSTDKQQVIQM